MRTSYCVNRVICRNKLKDGESKGILQKWTNWIFSPQFQVYVSQFLSSWGDRMWMFSGGLFLIEITPGSFRLVAIYEATLSLVVIILGSTVGRWVDRETRINAAQISLVIQNAMVCSCTLLLCFAISYQTHFSESLYGWGRFVSQAGVIAMASIAQLASLASKISIEKDWLVVISRSSKVELSTMNSVMRTVDLSTKMLAPVLVGFVMTSAGIVYGGIVIGVWNAFSMTIEYGLLHHLYYSIAELRAPKVANKTIGRQITDAEDKSILGKVKDAAFTWKLYFTHAIKYAGMSFALLYMTVLALDNFSRVYLYESGVSKAALGILTAVASLNGIAGSITFPFLHKRFGTVKTGLIGYVLEVTCLLFCVAAMFAPGTLFEPSALWHRESLIGNDTQSFDSSSNVSYINNGNSSQIFDSERPDNSSLENYYSSNLTELSSDFRNDTNYITQSSDRKDYTSAALLLTGIITSRLGLWLADLAVTQILQEKVDDTERGGINGVQYSLNQTFSMLRSLLLVILPSMKTFGYLVILSFVFVLIATILFIKYTHADILSKRNAELTSTECEKSTAISDQTTVI